MAVDVLNTANGREKTALSKSYAAAWFGARDRGERPAVGTGTPPDHPARPDKPELLSPRDVPKRKPGSAAGRIGFYDDWVKSAAEESKHFNLVCDCLEELGSFYGALPAHAYMWQAESDTADDLMGRLAVVPMVLEARGLDVTPGMIELFDKAGAVSAVEALKIIYSEEVAHVAYGSKWFNYLCGRHALDPKDVFHDLVRKYFRGGLKPPFNEEKRADAGLPPDFYWPLADQMGVKL